MNTLFELPEETEKKPIKKLKYAISVRDFEGNSYMLKREGHDNDGTTWFVLDASSRKKPSTWISLKIAMQRKEDVLRDLPAKYDKASVKVITLAEKA